MTTATPAVGSISDPERKAFLDREVAQVMRKPHRRLEYRSDFQAIIVRGKPVNHILHLLLTLCTVGLWGLVWLLIAANGGEKRASMQVNQAGQITISQR